MTGSRFIWDELPGIALLDALGLPYQNLVYSCFNYRPGPGQNLKTESGRRIFYTGERFLDDVNAEVVIGFLPEKIRLEDGEQPVMRINVLNGYTNTHMDIVPASVVMRGKRLFILLRDHERGELERLLKAGRDVLTATLYADLLLKRPTPDKKRFCCFIVSNPGCWQRNNFYDLLDRHQSVDSLGKHKTRLPVDIIQVPDRADEAYWKLIGEYKFMITFENESLPWYHTEKIWNAIRAGTVPIYWGDPLIDRVYKPEAFIWVKTYDQLGQQYAEFRRAIQQILRLDADPEAYTAMLRASPLVDAAAEDARVQRSLQKIVELAGDRGTASPASQSALTHLFIVPYRSRESQREEFIKHMPAILDSQLGPGTYKIWFIHQTDTRLFNRGALLNIGYLEARRQFPEIYKDLRLVFHDVDIRPLAPHILDYNTAHGAARHPYGDARPQWGGILGCFCIMTGADYEISGGSPNFFGWGGEDVALSRRCQAHGIRIDESRFIHRRSRSDIIDPESNPTPQQQAFCQLCDKRNLEQVFGENPATPVNTYSALRYNVVAVQDFASAGNIQQLDCEFTVLV